MRKNTVVSGTNENTSWKWLTILSVVLSVQNLPMSISLNCRFSALIWLFSWPLSYFASSTSVGRSKNGPVRWTFGSHLLASENSWDIKFWTLWFQNKRWSWRELLPPYKMNFTVLGMKWLAWKTIWWGKWSRWPVSWQPLTVNLPKLRVKSNYYSLESCMRILFKTS